MSWSDKDMDHLFRSAEDQSEFEYNSEFFKEIERQLPVQRSRRSLIWWVSSFSMFVLFSLLFFTRLSDQPVKLFQAKLDSPQKESGSTVKEIVETEHISESKDRTSEQSSVETKFFSGALAETSDLLNSKSEPTIPPVSSVETASSDVSINGNEIGILPPKNSSISSQLPAEELAMTSFNCTRKLPVSWYVQLNAGAQQQWTVEDSKHGLNMQSGISTGVDVRFGRWLWSAGASFNWQNLNKLEIRERTKIYGFGYSTYDNAYSFTGLASISVPVAVHYVAGRHQFGLSVEGGRNLFASMRRVQSMNGEVFRMTQGVTDVSLLQKYSVQPGLNYAYQMNEQISIGANVKYQLIHPLSSDRFEGVQTKHPIAVGISFKANLTE